jgi:hypothetical protein
MLLASLLAALVSAAAAIPVQGFLAIESGHATIGQGALGHFVTATIAGPGFTAGFFACGEEPCGKKKNPSLAVLRRLAKALGVPVTELLG